MLFLLSTYFSAAGLAATPFALHTACSPHDETDASTAQCQEWCRYASQCSFCKCRGCSMCQTCESAIEGDSSFAGCEDW